ncbi:MAG: EthD domain-containing protein [Pseudomonadales bacterium]|nr:EthD domain-containing protein [Pseudomonadales bacterium]
MENYQIQLRVFIVLSLLWFGPVSCDAFKPSPYNCDNTPEIYQNLPSSIGYMFILWRPASQTAAGFEEQLMAFLDTEPASLDGLNLKLMLQQPQIESITLRNRPLEDGSLVAALIAIGLASQADAILVSQLFESITSFVAAYVVERQVPRDYTRTWADGETSAGIQQVSFLYRKTGMEDQAFQDYWFCAHTPFALETHPIWRYERNQVLAVLTPDAPQFDGIVGLQMEQVSDLTDLLVFLGGNIFNGIRVQIDVQNFLNLDLIQVAAMKEVIISSDF